MLENCVVIPVLLYPIDNKSNSSSTLESNTVVASTRSGLAVDGYGGKSSALTGFRSVVNRISFFSTLSKGISGSVVKSDSDDLSEGTIVTVVCTFRMSPTVSLERNSTSSTVSVSPEELTISV